MKDTMDTLQCKVQCKVCNCHYLKVKTVEQLNGKANLPRKNYSNKRYIPSSGINSTRPECLVHRKMIPLSEVLF